MELKHGLHLAYCTNVHPGKDWAETLDSLERCTLRVRERVCPKGPYAIGLRLSDLASRELSEPATLLDFQRWLEKQDCYIFTINGFPFGRFHGTRVKEQVYLPDWTSPERLAYTNRLFDLLARLVPSHLEGSISTPPGSFKEFIRSPDQEKLMRSNLWRCVEYIEGVSRRSGRKLHLGLEPEPFGYFENTSETLAFFERFQDEHPDDHRWRQHLGVNYDTCHFAVAFEDPHEAIARFRAEGIKLSKIHISNAIKLPSSVDALRQLRAFADEVYLHQVNIRATDGSLKRYKDLDIALTSPDAENTKSEWRVHFHIPLHSPPLGALGNTQDHILGLFKMLEEQPGLCSHLEMETYTWAVLPEPLKSREVTEQLQAEYSWTLQRLAEHGLCEVNLVEGHA